MGIMGAITTKVVTIGGGTGHYVLLSGLKQFPFEISAVVSMADDGGSSGVLRDEMGVLPPGDIRQCLAALSEQTETLRALFNYRFSDGAMRGHSFGNLFLSALQKVMGSFSAAVEEASRLLAIKGKVIPVSEGDMRLIIELQDGTKIAGEKFLDASPEVRVGKVKKISLLNQLEATPSALTAIREADVIVIGPGDLYGSTLPPLLVPSISAAIRTSKAFVIYVANLTNKKGQTENFSVDDYVHSVNEYMGAHRINAVVCNSGVPPQHLLAQYESQEGKHALVSCGDPKTREYTIYSEDVLSQVSPMFHPQDALAQQGTRSFIRHDPQKLAKTVARIIVERGRK